MNPPSSTVARLEHVSALPPLDEDFTLVELLDRILNTGVVLVGDVTISVAGVDLIYLSLRALLCSVETAKGLDTHAPAQQLAAALTEDS